MEIEKNKALYESILKRVNEVVTKTLSESFEFEKDELAIKFVKILKSERLREIVKNAKCEDYRLLVEAVKAVCDAGVPEKRCPAKISNMRILSICVAKSLGEEFIKALKGYDEDRVNDLVEYVCNEMCEGCEECNCDNDEHVNDLPAATELDECGDVEE